MLRINDNLTLPLLLNSLDVISRLLKPKVIEVVSFKERKGDINLCTD